MTSFRRAAWQFCRMMKKHADNDETWAVYGRKYSEVFGKDEILEKWGSEVKGGPKTGRLNTDHVTLKFKLELLKIFSSKIGRKDARKFYHYMQNEDLIEIAHIMGVETIVDQEDLGGGFIEMGQVNPENYEVDVTIRLTNKGIDLADLSFMRFYSQEWTLLIAALALLVSVFALGATASG